jgi:O-antigen ligase
MPGLRRLTDILRGHSLETWLFLSYALFVLIQYLVPLKAFTAVAFYGVLLPLFIAYAVHNRQAIITLMKDPIITACLLIFAYIALHGLIIMPNPANMLKPLHHCLVTMVFLLCTTLIFAHGDEKHLHRFLAVLALIAGVAAVMSMGRYYYEHIHAPQLYSRLAPLGRTQHQIMGALAYGVAGIISLYMFRITAGKKRWLYIAALVAIGCMILLTKSRAPTGAYIFCLTLGYLFYYGSIRAPGIIAIVIALLILLLNWLVPSLQDYFTSYADSLLTRTDGHRFALWTLSLEGIREHPWIGNGLYARLDHKIAYSPHNMYLGGAFYFGIPYAVLFLYMVGRCIGRAGRLIRTGSGLGILSLLLLLQALLVGFTDLSQTVKGPGAMWLIFWLPVGCMAGVSLRRQAAQSSSSPA